MRIQPNGAKVKDMQRVSQILIACAALSAVFNLGVPRPAVAQDDLPIVAVFDIQSQSKKFKKRFVRKLTAQLRVKLAETKKLIIVDRGEQERELKLLLIEQQKASYKACVDEACQIPLGKMLAANQLLRTRISRFGKTYVLSSELIDIGTGGSADGATVKTDGTEDGMLAAVEFLARKLTGTGPLEGGSGETVILGAAGFEGLSTSGGEAGGKDGIVRFTSAPSGLKVWIDGRQLSGVTPLEDFVKLGKRKVRVGGSERYVDYEGKQKLRKNMNISVRLEPIVTDVVVVVRDSKDALVRNVPIELDGRVVARAPARLSRVLVGTHTLRTTTTYGTSTEQRIELKKGKEARIKLVVLDLTDHNKKLEAVRKRAEAVARDQRCAKAQKRLKSLRKSVKNTKKREMYCSRMQLDDCHRAYANGGRVNCTGVERRYNKCANQFSKRKRDDLRKSEDKISKLYSDNRDCRL